MKIVILDGYTENPGDLSWNGFEALGEVTVYDRTPFADGSGEIVLAFSTANRIQAGQIFHSGIYLNDEAFRPIFRAATETVEESIIRSMLEAETVTGRDGHIRLSLHDAMERAGLPR